MRNFLPLWIALLPTLPVLGAFAQDDGEVQGRTPATQDEIDEDPLAAPSWVDELPERIRKVDAEIQGCWMLTRFQSTARPLDNPVLENAVRGMMLIGGGFMSLEFHAPQLEYDDTDPGVLYQTGMHAYSYDPTGDMVTTSMIGTSNTNYDAEYGFEFERPGNQRTFRVIAGNDSLTLIRSDGMTLAFRRLNRPNLIRRDIFGREVGNESMNPAEAGGQRRRR